MPNPPRSLVLRHFEPGNMPFGSTIYVNGKRGTGKTKLIIDLLAFFRNCSHCVVFCPTLEAEKTYAQHVPKLFIFKQWTREAVERIYQAQIALGESVTDYPCVIVFDDCLFDPSFSKDISTRNLYMNGRHANITVITAGQYMMDLPPAIRTNTDYIFMLAENGRSNREKLYKNFGGIFDKFSDFNDCLQQSTVDYCAMVINNKELSNDVAKVVSYYKATLGLRFRMGHPSVWEYAQEKQDDEHREALPPPMQTDMPALTVVHGPRRHRAG